MLDESTSQDAESMLSALDETRASRLFCSPALLDAMLQERDSVSGGNLPQLNLCFVTGEPLRVRTANQFRKVLGHAVLVNGYGTAETASVATAHVNDQLPPEATTVPVGKPVANTQVKVLDARGKFRPLGIPGEVWISGDSLAHGLLRDGKVDPGLLALTQDPDDIDKRWFRTGDMGRWLPDGNLEILGRTDEGMNVGGVMGHRAEVERILRSHPDVDESLVRPLRGAGGQSRLVGYVVPVSSSGLARERELVAFLKDQLPANLVPDRILVLEEIPRALSGKVDWASLPEAPVIDEPTHRPMPPRMPDTELERDLANMWGVLLGGTPASTNASFLELGGDFASLGALALGIGMKFNRQLSLQQLADHPTISEMAALIQEGETDEDHWSAALRLRAGGIETPLFLVHDTGLGCLDLMQQVADSLDSDRPVYALAARPLSGAEEFSSVQAMAQRYLSAMREIHPRGPCFIGGLRFGGRVALEIARQMWATNQEVPLVALIESHPHVAGSLREKIARGIWKSEDPKELARVPRSVEDFEFVHERLTEIAKGQVHLSEAYFDTPYDGKLALLRTKARPFFGSHTSDHGWSRLATGGVEVHPLDPERALDAQPEMIASILGRVLHQHEPGSAYG